VEKFFRAGVEDNFSPHFCPKKIQSASKMDTSDAIETMVNERNRIFLTLFGLIGDESRGEK
jgi:hypothetical protein